MHQTFYIDIDEEITSIVERLRNAKSNEAVIVVPKRALLIQSIVNLRLLKKEADSLGISISIVTQDNLGKVIVEKAGISCQERLEETKDDEIADSGNRIGEGYFNKSEYQEMGTNFPDHGNNRMDKIGSDTYFSVPVSKSKNEAKADLQAASKSIPEITKSNPDPMSNEKIVNKELVTGISEDIKRKTPASFDLVSPAASGFSKETKDSTSYFVPQKPLGTPQSSAFQSGSGDRKIDNFFQHSNYIGTEEKKDDFKNANLSRRIKKAFWAFGIVVLFIIIGAAAYLFVPKASVLISVKSDEKTQDAEVKGDVNAQTIDYNSKIIPVKLISETVEVSQSATSSGSKTTTSQKARGTITIYNEFSSASQSLVATTRFESEGGKIFRIEKGITVPGTTTVGGEVKPGVIEAEVVADGAGDEYNVGAGKFTIPGFKDNGNDKYNKIYAKSTKAMAGGGSSSGANQNNAITNADINNAKSNILKELNEAAKNKIKASTGGSMIVLDEAINMDEATYSLSNSAGEVVDKFEIKGQVKVNALVFSETDLKNVVGKIIAESGNGKVSIDGASVALVYGKADLDFKAGTMNIKVRGTSSAGMDVDTESLKKGILGKSNEELEAYLNSYPSIEKVDVVYWPPFMNKKIPLYDKRVDVKIESSSSSGVDK